MTGQCEKSTHGRPGINREIRYETTWDTTDGLRERVVRQRARFIDDYDDYVDQARLDLGKLFRIEDYPSKEALQGKFAIRYRITPVPDADHFIAKLASDDTDRVKRDIERHIEEQLHDAVGDLYRRLSHRDERHAHLTSRSSARPMNTDAPGKVRSHHLGRNAYLYVRQSSLRQVLEHTESTERQYALKQRATALGSLDAATCSPRSTWCSSTPPRCSSPATVATPSASTARARTTAAIANRWCWGW